MSVIKTNLYFFSSASKAGSECDSFEVLQSKVVVNSDESSCLKLSDLVQQFKHVSVKDEVKHIPRTER